MKNENELQSYHQYDVAIIGAGPGGYVAAIRAVQLGFKTVCVNKYATLGGSCLNVGCIPSKALLQSTELLFRLKNQGKELGIECPQLSVDFSQMMARKKQVVKSLVDGIAGIFNRRQITSLQGIAEFIDPHRLKISQENGLQQEIEATHILIATGSEPIPLPQLPFHEHQVVSSTGALSLSTIPERLMIIGGGVIGVELASVYQRLGSQVTVIEMLDHICPGLDPSLSKNLLQILKKQGIEFMLSTRMTTAIVQPEEVILTVEGNGKLQNLSANVVLVAVGRRPYTEGLGLEKVGIQRDKRGFISVDGHFRTSQPHIFAIGDVIEGPMLAHRASAEGVAVIESLKGEHSVVDYLSIPNVVYTYPEVASVGLTEEEAKQAGLDLMIGTSFFRANPRARCSDETEGFIKVIGDKLSGHLVGMHMIGPHVSELIAEGMLAMQQKLLVKEIGEAAQAHPTLSEAIKEAALDALGRAIHH
jgi:dihydrolipoamide dehydrogenase